MKNKKSISVIILAIISMFGLISCKGKNEMESNNYEQISQEEAKQLMDTETDYIILDVRTMGEYNESHIAGAICVPNETITDTEPKELPDKDQLILVYCRSGNRSRQAAVKLTNLGYSNIKEFGGINTWKFDLE